MIMGLYYLALINLITFVVYGIDKLNVPFVCKDPFGRQYSLVFPNILGKSWYIINFLSIIN